MDTDTAMTIVEAIAELNRRAERIRELEAESKRLRALAGGSVGYTFEVHRELEAENQRLREQLSACEANYIKLADMRHETSMENQRLREALRTIEHTSSERETRRTARAALNMEKGDA